ncbi:MAG TPA: DUF5915 domain-containing protein, partial [Longimicrobium sp.]|nr:DUF5915 domain-containing protein [Longimicrobium sp.]
GTVYAVVPDGYEVDETLLGILRDELNVRAVKFMDHAEDLVSFSAKPNFKGIGKVHGKNTQAAAAAVRELSSASLAAFRRGEPVEISYTDGQTGQPLTFALTDAEFDVVQTAEGDFHVEAEASFTVALDPTITPELRLEGLARELVNRVQNLRKESGFEVSDRIRLGIFGDGEILDVAREWGEFVARETLGVAVESGSVTDEGYEAIREVDLDGVTGTVGIARVPKQDA